MPTAGYSSVLYITTTDTAPTSADRVGSLSSVSYNRTRAELDASYMGDAETGFILGKKGAELSLSFDYDSANAGQSRIEAAFDSGATIYAHLSLDGGTACKKVPVKVPAFNVETSQDGKVSASLSLKSVGAVSTSTAS
jgi:hypothetical protein